MAASKSTGQNRSLPKFAVPSEKELWELGEEKNWSDLDALLQPFDFGKFWVVDGATERHLADIRSQFDDSCASKSDGRPLNCILWGGDNEPLFRRVLALGVHPDLPGNGFNFLPSHDAAYYARPNCARVLAFCRPSLTARNSLDVTVLDLARQRGGPELISICEGVEKEGFPSVAKLAHLKEWAPLQNLCRRRVISPEEAGEKFDGKNAVEWALDHGEMGLAKELQYLLNPPSSAVPPLAEKAKTFFSANLARLEFLSEQLAVATESLSRVTVEIAELKQEDSLKAAEISELKRKLDATNAFLVKKDVEISELKESVIALDGRTHDLTHEFGELNRFFDSSKSADE